MMMAVAFLWLTQVLDTAPQTERTVYFDGFEYRGADPLPTEIAIGRDDTRSPILSGSYRNPIITEPKQAITYVRHRSNLPKEMEETQRPSSIRLNQLGVLPQGPKRALMPNPAKYPLRWRLVDQYDVVRAEGLTSVLGDDAASGEHLHLIDFSRFEEPGVNYRLVVGDAASRTFPVGDGVYDRLPADALAYFYHNRAGMPIEARFVGERWARPAGHPHEIVRCVSGTDPAGNVWPACGYELDVTGGWYDAGDHGKYVVNGGIALWTLLNLHEFEGTFGRAPSFPDGASKIPEAGNKVSDLLDEARWEIEFLLRMQVPEGRRLLAPVAQKRGNAKLVFSEIDASGMAHHKVADAHWTPLPTAPHEDKEQRLLFPPSTAATLNLAATAAQCARIWRTIDATFSARCLAAAERAWVAARRNPQVYAVADFTGSGGYGDGELSDEFYWAAAELLATTGKTEYAAAVRRSPHFSAPLVEPSWSGTAALGTISLATSSDLLETTELTMLRARIVEAADRFLADCAKVGYRLPYAPRGYPWGSTSSVLNRAVILAYAHQITGEVKYKDGVVDAMDFILGRNPLDQSFVSGYGARPLRNPHHRFWAHQLDPVYPPPPPGALSGGPNNTAMSDPVASSLKGKCPPQSCWRDDIRAYALNEVAINWNAPLVWVAAFLAE